jgi:hypothetical protein
LPTTKELVSEVREDTKPLYSLSFEHEIQNIRITVPLSELVKNEYFKRSLSKLLPVPLSELVKNEDFKRSLSKLLQFESPQLSTDLVNIQYEKPVVVLGPMV